jgi:hypothetical protein
MKLTLLLADFAEAINNKLYIMGGGWSVIGPDPATFAIAVKLEVPWDETNKRHQLELKLVDADEKPIMVPTPVGDKPLEIGGEFEVGRPVGLKPGTPLDVALAFNMGPLPLPSDTRCVWRCYIDGNTRDEWQSTFTTRPAK